MESPAANPSALQIPAPRRVAPRTLIASLWLFAILNYVYCDILGLYWADHLNALLAGAFGGMAITQEFLLGSAVLMSIPIASTLIARIAPHGFARWASVAAGVVMTLVQAASLTVGDGPTLHYIYFSVIEIATTAFIAWYAAFRWTAEA